MTPEHQEIKHLHAVARANAHDRTLAMACKLGALQGAAEHALQMLTARPAYLTEEEARISMIHFLRTALAHDGTMDYYERLPARDLGQ